MRFFTLLLILISFSTQAQRCSSLTGPGRVPQTAISVCGSVTFQQPSVPSCTGPALPYTNCAASALSDNSVWYKFHCYQGGTLAFMILPYSFSDDYDWHLADITGHAPQDVFTTDLLVSLNLSAATPNTGCSAAGTSNVNCEGATDPLNSMPILVAGHDYLLCVTNWTNSLAGYDINFLGGTAIIADQLPPSITSVNMVGCSRKQFHIDFSEEILCSSLTAAGTEFTITNGTHTILSTSSVCSITQNTFTSLDIFLQDPLPGGNYQLIVNNGSDLNTLQDVCQTEMVAGTSFPFVVGAPPELVIKNVIYNGCAPSILKVALNNPVLCNSVTPTGSEFSLGTGNPAITAVQSACSPSIGFTDTLILVLQSPLPHGNYQLTVNNGTDLNTLKDTCGTETVAGYQFPFVINQITTAPAIQTIVFNECAPDLITVYFDKALDCNTVSTDGSEFSITPGIITVTAATTDCSVNRTKVVLQLSAPMAAGNFTLHINNGTDLNTISDSCFAFMPINSTKNFVTTKAPAPIYDSLQYDKCSPLQIKIFYNHPIRCGTYSCAGEEFLITGPQAVSITSIEADRAHCCPDENGSFQPGYSNWLIVHLSQPILTAGNYILYNSWGIDNNSVLDTCGAAQDTLETIGFNVLGVPSAIFNDQLNFGCEMDTLVLSHPGGNNINSWTWNFSDGTNASGQTATHNFPVSTDTATVQLIVSNGICSDTLLRKYRLDNAINADFTVSTDTSCINKNIGLINNSSGNNLQWLWQFGDNTHFNGQSPATHTYTSSNSYNINLIITNDHGCSDTAVKTIAITQMPVVDFTGLNIQYCTGDTLTLIANLQGDYIGSYTWNTGTGLTFQDQPIINFPYSSQGLHTVELSTTDRFCGLVKKDSSTKVYLLPVLDLGTDKKLCPGLTVQIGPNTFPGYTYLWSNNAATAQIITSMQTNTYFLTVNNNGCKASDEIVVTVLDHCLIKVPGAFTPNQDGLNDRLKAINADLATHFSLSVYNRFGQLLFSTNDPLAGWDGRFKGQPADAGTYVWQLHYVDPVSNKPVYEKGTSILIR